MNRSLPPLLRRSLLPRLAAIVSSAALATSNTEAQAPQTPSPAAPRLLAAWSTAANVGLSIALYEDGAPHKSIKKFADAAAAAAKELSIDLPPPPEKTADKEATKQTMVAFITKQLAKTLAEKLKDGPEIALTEIGLKSAVLTMIYKPGDEPSLKLANGLAERARKVGIPDQVMAGVVEKVEKGAPLQEVRDAVTRMQDVITIQLGGRPPELQHLSVGSEYLENALISMGKAKGYRVKGVLTFPDGAASELTGSVGTGKMEVTTVSPDKSQKKHRIVVGKKAVITLDGGKSWKLDPDSNTIILLSNTITGAVDSTLGIPLHLKFEILGEEKLGDENVLHVQAKVKGEDDRLIVHDYWIAKDPTFTTIIRRSKIPVMYDKVEAIADIVYTDVGTDPTIEIPAGAGL